MPAKIVAAVLFCAFIGFYQTAGAGSAMNILDNLNRTANSLNSELLNSFDGSSNQDPLTAYRQKEVQKVRQFSEASGVGPNIIREQRRAGATWEQLAQKYGISLNGLPAFSNK